jgi:glucosylceramidase
MPPFAIRLSVLALGIALLPGSAIAQNKVRRASDRPFKVEVFESTTDLKESLLEKDALSFGSARLPAPTINVDSSKTYQLMEGFGASITDSSAWLLYNKLDTAQRKELMAKLFDPVHGIGLSFIRQPMGASDFALDDYSYDDLPQGQTDPDMKHFSIARDQAYIIPVLREALGLNPHLKIVATPWSPPGWMKTSGSMIEGRLLPSAYGPLAKYFVKFVQAYEVAGVPIYAVTMQNEPLNIPKDYPGMGMSAEEQASFLRDNLGPAFLEARPKTKIMVFDHNWNLIDYPISVMMDPKAANFTVGIATHCYGGTAAAQEELHSRFPDKGIWMTECSGGDWQTGRILEDQIRLIINSTRHWAKSVVLWNLALDQDHGPHTGGCKNCRALVTVTDTVSPSTTEMTVDYVAEAHVSKFVVPGAYRIESNTFEQGSLEGVAFRNPDGSIVLLVLNGSYQPMSFNVEWQGQYFSSSLQAGSVATFVWRSAPSQHQ